MQKMTIYGLLLLTFLIQACGGGELSSDLIDRIPAESVAVMTVDIGQIMKKAEYEQLKKTDAVKEASEKSALVKKLIDKPNESGIDLNKRMYGFVTLGASMNEPGFSAFMLAVSDVAKMEAVMAEIPGMESATEKDGYKMVTTPEQQIIAWSKEVLVVANQATDGETRLKTLFSGGGEGSIKKSFGFKQSMGVDHDIVFWGNTNPIAKMMEEGGDGANSMLSMAGFQEDALNDNFVMFYADYEKGAAKFGSEYEFNKSVREDIGGIFRDKPKMDLAKYIPSKGLIGTFHLSLSPEGIKNAINKGGRGMLANSFLSNQGVNLDEILKAFSGDVLMSVHGNPSSPEFMFTMSVGDKKAVEGLLSLMMEKQTIPITKMDGTYMIQDDDGSLTEIVLTDNVLSLSSNKDFLAKVKDGGFSGSEKADIGESGTGLLSLYMDFEEIRKSAPTDQSAMGMPGLIGTAMKNETASNFVLYLKREEGMAKLNMADDSRNSLAILIEQAIKAAQEESIY